MRGVLRHPPSRPHFVLLPQLYTGDLDMAQIQLYDPFADASFDDLFRGFFRPVRVARNGEAQSFRIDVSETDRGYVVHAEIPGVAKDDLQVTIEGNQVTIGAEVKRETEAKDGGKWLHRERYAGSLFRSFTLPAELDETTSEARYENGVLELKLAKKPQLAGRRLTIQ